MENVIKYQIEVTELKSTITKLKNTLEGSTNTKRSRRKDHWALDKAVELDQSEQQIQKRMRPWYLKVLTGQNQ